MRDCDDHLVIGIEILWVEVARCAVVNLTTTLITVLILNLIKFVLDDLLTELLVGKDSIIVLNLAHELLVLGMQLVLLDSGKLSKTHLDNCGSLNLAEVEALHEGSPCIGRRLGSLDKTYHLVDVVRSDDQALNDVGTLLGLAELVLCTADNHLMTVLNEVADAVLECEQLWTSLYKSNTVHAERCLQ